jgi:peptidoglycan/LPS O-acetylase OafA/YrhL
VLYGWLPSLTRPLSFVIDSGYLGVDLFFALSGFVIAHKYLDAMGASFDGRATGRFLWLRFARLYPVHLLMTLVVGAWLLGRIALGLAPSEPLSDAVMDLPSQLSLTQAWFNQPGSWNGVAWTVSLEWLAYLSFPLIALAVFRTCRGRSAALAGLVVVALVYAPLVLGAAEAIPVAPMPDGGRPPGGAFGIDLLRIIAGFVGGVAVLVITRRFAHRTRIVVLNAALALVILCLLGALFAMRDVGALEPRLVVAPVFPVIVGLIALGALSKLLGRKWLQTAGLSSYSLYMTHWMVLILLGATWYRGGFWAGEGLADTLGVGAWAAPWRLAYLVFVVVACFTVAWATWRFFEEPWRRRMRTWGRRPGPPTVRS